MALSVAFESNDLNCPINRTNSSFHVHTGFPLNLAKFHFKLSNEIVQVKSQSLVMGYMASYDVCSSIWLNCCSEDASVQLFEPWECAVELCNLIVLYWPM